MLETVRQVLNGEVMATWIDDITPPQPSRCLRGMLSLANGPQTLQEFDMTSLRQTWRVHGLCHLCHSKSKGQYHAFAAPPPPPRDWHGGPFSTHGELAQGLSLTIRPSRTASPLCLFAAPQWPETGRFWGMFSKIRLNIHSSQLT